MVLLRDLVRDLVGIIFPGGLVILLLTAAIGGILVIFFPADSLKQLVNASQPLTCALLIILSYIAGQLLRLKQLHGVEMACTKHHRLSRSYTDKQSEERMAEMEELASKCLEDSGSEATRREHGVRLQEAYGRYIREFGLWERFPYSRTHRLKWLARYPAPFARFYEPYAEMGLLNEPQFFTLMKRVLYECSPESKEELMHQEGIVRLLAGLTYAAKLAIGILGFLAGLHAFLLVLYAGNGFAFPEFVTADRTPGVSVAIIAISALFLFLAHYTRNEILLRLRHLRAKELQTAYTGFYLLMKKDGDANYLREALSPMVPLGEKESGRRQKGTERKR